MTGGGGAGELKAVGPAHLRAASPSRAARLGCWARIGAAHAAWSWPVFVRPKSREALFKAIALCANKTQTSASLPGLAGTTETAAYSAAATPRLRH